MLKTVVHIITGLKQGGAENALYRFVNFSKNEIRHVVISLGDRGEYGDKLSLNEIEFYELRMTSRGMNLKSLIRLYRLLKKINPDLIQTWMYHADLIGGLISKVAGFRVFWGIHNFNLKANGASLSTRIVARICSLLSWFLPEKIITVSSNSIETHKKYGYDSRKFVTIPLGYDLKEFKFIENARNNYLLEASIPETAFVIGCIARWDPQKDHKNLLIAFKQLSQQNSNVYCLLFGSQINLQNSDLVNLITTCGVDPRKVLLCGQTNSVPEIMSIFDVHVLSSIGEAFPNVVAEAMACEIPCVVTNVGDSAKIVGDYGWVVPHSNSEKLYMALRESLVCRANVEKWQIRKKEGRKRILQNYSLNIMVSNYKHVWGI
jgi:glycosyltransferase involved in cell wall biosynthesis